MERIRITDAEVRRTILDTGRYTEDGLNVVDEVYYVEAYDRAGRAFRHPSLASQDRLGLERAATMISARGSIDGSIWLFDRWTYGSAGWNAQEVANEIEDARRAGEAHPLDGGR